MVSFPGGWASHLAPGGLSLAGRVLKQGNDFLHSRSEGEQLQVMILDRGFPLEGIQHAAPVGAHQHEGFARHLRHLHQAPGQGHL